MIVNDRVVVQQDALALALQIVELTSVEGPAEDADDHQHEAGRERDQQVHDVHVSTRPAAPSLLTPPRGAANAVSVGVVSCQACVSGLRQRAARSALSTTTSELLAMPMPAAQGGSQPASASGMQAAL